ncbi:hypothetical protein Bbelb_169060 [Branchiostoma belcheri]|nr:hypothetical protein Bbelb_169060 [Branchiostoma belcheri]
MQDAGPFDEKQVASEGTGRTIERSLETGSCYLKLESGIVLEGRCDKVVRGEGGGGGRWDAGSCVAPQRGPDSVFFRRRLMWKTGDLGGPQPGSWVTNGNTQRSESYGPLLTMRLAIFVIAKK